MAPQRSLDLAWGRHGSFCDSGCGLAAPPSYYFVWLTLYLMLKLALPLGVMIRG